MSLPALLVLATGGLVFLGLLFTAIRNPLAGIYIFVFLSSITDTPELPVVGDRLVAADFIMIATIASAGLRGMLTRPAPRGAQALDLLGLVFIGLCSVSSLLATLASDEPGRPLLFLLIYVYGYLCFRLIVRAIDTPERFVRLCLAWALGGALVTVVGLLASSDIYRPEWTYDPIINRINSTMKSSGQVSSYLGPALFIFGYMAVHRGLRVWQRLVAIGLLAGAAVVLLGTGSRISFVILVFSIVYLLASMAKAHGRSFQRGPVLAAALIGVAAFGVYSLSVWDDHTQSYGLVTTSPFERALRIFSETSEMSDAGAADWGGTRYEETETVFAHWGDNPFWGVGSGLFSSTYHLNEVHNTYFSILGENGLPAFAVFLLWWLLMAAHLLRAALTVRGAEAQFAARLIFGAFLALCIYQVTTNGMRQRPFWITPAVALAGTALLRRGSRSEAPAPAATIAVAP